MKRLAATNRTEQNKTNQSTSERCWPVHWPKLLSSLLSGCFIGLIFDDAAIRMSRRYHFEPKMFGLHGLGEEVEAENYRTETRIPIIASYSRLNQPRLQ